MEKLNYSALKRDITTTSISANRVLDLEQNNGDCPYHEWLDISQSDSNAINIANSWKKKVAKTDFIYNTIHDNNQFFYSSKANELNVSLTEINTTYNRYITVVNVIENKLKINENSDFVMDLYSEARQVIVDEKKEKIEFQNKGTLRKILDKNPIIQQQRDDIYQVTKSIYDVNSQRQILSKKIMDKEISVKDAQNEIDELYFYKEKFEEHLINLSNRYRQKIQSAKYKRRRFLKKCFNINDLESEVPGNIVTISYKTIEVGKFVIEEYCRWFNNKYEQEIKLKRKETINENKRIKRLEQKSETPQIQLKKERTIQVEELFVDGLSNRQIAKETNIPPTSVDRIIKELKSKI